MKPVPSQPKPLKRKAFKVKDNKIWMIIQIVAGIPTPLYVPPEVIHETFKKMAKDLGYIQDDDDHAYDENDSDGYSITLTFIHLP